MKYIFIVLFTHVSIATHAQIDFLGTWVSYGVVSNTDDNFSIVDEENFEATLFFFSDSSFRMITPGKKAMRGYYSTSNTSLTLYEQIDPSTDEQFWTIEWPPNTKDPYPTTEGLDILIPVKWELYDEENNRTVEATLLVLFRRIE